MTISSAEEFYRLRVSEDPAEYGVAARGSATNEVWREVIDRYPDMREWVAYNKSVPIEILELLSVDDDERVRRTVAMRRKLSVDLFERLSADTSIGVRMMIASNANTPARIRQQLAQDPNSDVSGAALEALKRFS